MLLKFAIKDFLDDREFKNLRKSSIQDYKFTLDEFHDFAVNNEIVNVEDINTSSLKQYFLYCQNNRGNNPTTINHKVRNLKSFFNYLEQEEIISSKGNPSKKITYLKEDIRIEAFTDYHIKQMLRYFRRLKGREKTFNAYRNYTMIITLLGTGIS